MGDEITLFGRQAPQFYFGDGSVQSVIKAQVKRPSSASLELANYFRIDMPGVLLRYVNFGAGESRGSPNWLVQIETEQETEKERCFVGEIL